MKSGLFDITKIPDIYDCIKYDMMHNYSIKSLGFDKMEDLYINAQALADVIVPQVGAGMKLPMNRCRCLIIQFISLWHRFSIVGLTLAYQEIYLGACNTWGKMELAVFPYSYFGINLLQDICLDD